MTEQRPITAVEATAAITKYGYFLARIEAVEDFNDKPSGVEIVASGGDFDGVGVTLSGIAYATVEMTSEAAREAAAALVAAADYLDQAEAARVTASEDADADEDVVA